MLTRLSIRDIVLIDRLDHRLHVRPVRADRRDRGRQVDPARRLCAGARRARRRRAGAPWCRAGSGDRGVRSAATTIRSRALLAANDIAADDELILRRVQFADGRTRAFVNDQPVSVQALQRSARRWSRSMASTTSAPWSMPPPIGRCSMPSAGSRARRPRSSGCGTSGAPARPRWLRSAPRSSARSARPTGCATRSRSSRN